MVQTIQARDVTLGQLETHFQLQRVEDEQFFPEWHGDLPELTDWQNQLLEQVRSGYFNLLKQPPLLEKPINLPVVSPLLFIGQFYLSPWNLRAESSVQISAQDEERGIIVKGNLDTLMITTGGSFLFLKVVKDTTPLYAMSDLFGIGNRQNGLGDVLKILKKLIYLSISANLE
ncbi:restriction endonuclease subunit R [Coleofasciculus sp. E1-EBD-02]|uniref:restriction endonuclease subunit R n=1 Tax=Coleofasciculus sp. E1-EBD-02 TaxID=3068481 RepID=UPI0032F9EF76